MPDTLANPTKPATRDAKNVSVEQVIFRTKASHLYNLITVLNCLHAGGKAVTPEDRERAEAQLRRGEAISTKDARYQVIPEHVDPIEWIFTFGHGQPYFGGYVRITGRPEVAIAEMERRYGRRWSMMYASAEAAGVDRFRLFEVRG